MKFEQILQLVDAVSVSALTEFKYEEGGVKISMKKAAERNSEPVSMPVPISEPSFKAEEEMEDAETITEVKDTDPAKDAAEAESGQVVVSPLVGTFYAAPAEDAEPYVKVGDQVKKGQVLAIVEAMKLMNEIESDYSGKVIKILAENGMAVEYGQPLFEIKEDKSTFGNSAAKRGEREFTRVSDQ